MRDNRATLIEEWFATQSASGEFVQHARHILYSVIGQPCQGGRIVFLTKPGVVAKLLDVCAMPGGFAVVGRYGLPHISDLGWIARLVGSSEFVFFGDLDPVDLMIYAWLRAQFPSPRIMYLGISDRFIAALKTGLPKNAAIPCSSSEKRSLPLLTKVLDNMEELVGLHCAAVMKQGKKIEVEAICTSNGKAGQKLINLLAHMDATS